MIRAIVGLVICLGLVGVVAACVALFARWMVSAANENRARALEQQAQVPAGGEGERDCPRPGCGGKNAAGAKFCARCGCTLGEGDEKSA